MLKAYKYRIYPTNEQKEQIAKTFGCCRFVYNRTLAYRKEAYEKEKKNVNKTNCNNYCNQVLKKEYGWLKEVDKFALTNAIYNMDAAYQKFFKEHTGYPKFKSKHDGHQSYTTNFSNGNIKEDFDRGKVKLPKLKEVKAKLHRNFSGQIKSATVSQKPCGKYYVSILVETEHVELAHTDQNTGIDLGIKDLCITSKGKPIKPKTIGQKRYCSQIAKNTVTIGVGPAGTGKTYLAVAMAVTAFRSKQINRIILTRPAVEAGEKLGFLPGDLQSKVDPYLRPLYDALFDMLGAETYQKYVERGNIEVAPLAYMRGRTLDDSFIILDEAQNTTREQMKMFLTRLGFNSKMVITGDITQIDLPNGAKSGLKDCIKILKNIDDIGTCFFDEKDVVRHRLVQDIIKAYAKFENTDINNLRNNGSKNNGSKN